MGIIMSALAAAGDAGVQSMNQNIDQLNKLDMEKQRSLLEMTKARDIAEFTNQLQNAPAIAAGGYLKDAASQPIPVQAAPIKQLSGNDPNSGYVPTPDQAAQEAATGSAGMGLDPSKTPDLIKRIQALPDDNPDKAPMLAQLQRQAASDQQAAQDAVAGQTRNPTMQEALQAAIQRAANNGDAKAYEMLKKLAGDKYIPVPYGGVLDTQTGEIKGQQTYKTDIASAQEEGKNQRAEDKNQTTKDVAAAKLAGQYPDPASITQQEKDNWLHTYVANNGSMPRSAPAYVRNSIGTWAAQKGIMPSDLASGMAQAKYDAASANTAGHRAGTMAGVEAVIPALADNAIDLAQKLDQGRFVPVNKLMQMGESSISDPDLSAFKVANQALISEYQQVISRGGAGNVTSLNEAMKVLNGATSPEAYKSAVSQVMREVAMNTAGMAKVRSDLGGNKTDTVPSPFTPKPTASTSSNPVLNYDPATGTFH